MKLDAIIIQNFRSFQGKTMIPVSSITTFVGRNDAGKSSILDALGVFFEHPLNPPRLVTFPVSNKTTYSPLRSVSNGGQVVEGTELRRGNNIS